MNNNPHVSFVLIKDVLIRTTTIRAFKLDATAILIEYCNSDEETVEFACQKEARTAFQDLTERLQVPHPNPKVY